VEDHLEVEPVQRLDDPLWIGEVGRVERELAVVRVPAGRREAGAQIDERVAWQSLFAERARDLHNLIAP
jgi:hypothetical protein